MVAHMPMLATFENEYLGLPPTGKGIEILMANVWRLKDGKIVEAWPNMDTLALMQQLGAIPSARQAQGSASPGRGPRVFARAAGCQAVSTASGRTPTRGRRPFLSPSEAREAARTFGATAALSAPARLRHLRGTTDGRFDWDPSCSQLGG